MEGLSGSKLTHQSLRWNRLEHANTLGAHKTQQNRFNGWFNHYKHYEQDNKMILIRTGSVLGRILREALVGAGDVEVVGLRHGPAARRPELEKGRWAPRFR